MKLTYEAYDSDGTRIADTISAGSVAEASEKLRAHGLIPLSVRPCESGSDRTSSRPFRLRRRNDLKRVSDFCRQLSVLVGAGTPEVQALGAVERQQDDPVWAGIVTDIRSRVENGASLSGALEHHRKRFDVICQSLVAAGESSGQLKPMLDRLAQMTRQRLRVRNAILGSLAYPSILLFVSMVVMVAMITFVLPRFADLFDTLGAPLPPSTQLLMNFSSFIRMYWWAIAPGVVGAVVGAVFWATRPAGKQTTGIYMLNVPVLGRVARHLITARIVRLLGTLLESKVSLLDALELCGQAAGNERYRQLIGAAQTAVTDGDTLTAAFRNSRLITPTVVEAMDTGERTGTLGCVLIGIADVLDEDNEITLRSMSSIVEPFILILLGFVVGFVALSMFLPLLDLTSATQGVG